MSLPVISVIVPVYNVKNYLRQCLDSLISQTYRQLEIIIIDDGSTDGSSIICDEYKKDQRIKVIHKTNGGLSSARNIGLEQVSGDYISFIDSDDWLDSDFYEKSSIGFEFGAEVINASYSIYYNGSVTPVSNSIPAGLYKQPYIFFNFEIPLLETGAHMPVWPNLYSRKLISRLNISFVSEREVYAEDDLFNTVIYGSAKSIYVADTKSYIHRIVKGSLSQSYRKGLFNMLSHKRKLKEAYFRNQNKIELLNILHSTRPKEIAACLYKQSLCGYKEAINNVRSICESSRSVFDRESNISGKFKPLYILGKYKQYTLIIILSKLMNLGEPIYRRLYLR